MSLSDLINSDQAIEAAAQARDFETVLAWLNDPTAETRLQDRLCTDRTILAEVINPATGQADPAWSNAILDKLDAIAAVNSMVKRAMNRVYGDGLDIGNAATQAQLDALVKPDGLTQAEADALKALGMQPCSRATLHTGRDATLQDLWTLYPV